MNKTGQGWWALAGAILGLVVVLLALYVGTYYATVYPVHGGAEGIGSGTTRMVFPKVNARYDKIFGIEPHGFFSPVHAIDRILRPKVWEAGPPFPVPTPPLHRPLPDARDQSSRDSVEPSLSIISLIDDLRHLPDVAAVTVDGDTDQPTGIIIHIRNWHYLPVELFAADILAQSDEDIPTEEIERRYLAFLEEVDAVQKQQVPVLNWLADHGLGEVWYEGVTEESLASFEKDAADFALWEKFRTTRLALGAPGRMLAEGKMKVLALEDGEAMDAAEPDAVTAEFTEEDNARREAAMVCRIVSAGKPVNVVMLGGAHDLRDGLRRLRCEGWCVVTVDVRAYREAVGEE